MSIAQHQQQVNAAPAGPGGQVPPEVVSIFSLGTRLSWETDFNAHALSIR